MHGINLNLIDANIIYYPKVFNNEECNHYFTTLLNTIKWQQDNIKLFGKIYPQPRLTALYAKNSNTYSYSGIKMHPYKLTEELEEIQDKVENISNNQFTSCLLNLYRNGSDSNGWHSDDEKELGNNPIIASVSFGAERIFHFKHKTKPLKHKLVLQNGSLLLMKRNTQHHWLHQLPKTKRKVDKRINLTFRIIN